MNFRVTMVFFALLLTTLFAFGLMIARRKSTGDVATLSPTLGAPDAKVHEVLIKGTIKENDKDKEVEYLFTKLGDYWYHMQGEYKAKVEGFRIEKQIIDKLKDARHEESADISREPKFYMEPGRMTVTLKGKYKEEDKTWEFNLGKESPDRAYVYATSSERPNKVYAVSSKALADLFFKDARHLRSKRLFDFIESSVTSIHAKQPAKELEVKRSEGGLWNITKPPLGFAGFESEPDEKKKEFQPKETGITSVKSLINNIITLRIEDDEDFEPLGKPHSEYGLGKDQETLRIDITSAEKKDSVTDTLFIGKKVPAAALRGRTGDYYYARLAIDDNIMHVSAKWLEGIEKAIQDPGKLRSKDLAAFEAKDVDHLVIKQGDQEFKFFKLEGKEDMIIPGHPKFGGQAEWFLFVGKEKHKANNKAVESLIEHLQGKKAIVGFEDVAEADVAKREADWGIDKKSPEISVFVNAVEKKKEDDKEEKKDEKKPEAKKDEADKNAPPTLKKDLKPALTLVVGTVGMDKDKEKDKELLVHVRRVMDQGKITGRVTVKKEFIEKLLPPEGIELAFMDASMPKYDPQEAVALKFVRTGDKGPETLEFVRRNLDGKRFWYQKDPNSPDGFKLADTDQVMNIIGVPSNNLATKKIVKKVDEKEDLDKFGLKTPTMLVNVTLTKRNEPVPPAVVGRIMGMLATFAPLEVVADAFAQMEGVQETITIEFGNEPTDEKDKPGVYARHSGAKFVYLVDPRLVKALREIDVRDRITNQRAQPMMEALHKGAVAADPFGAFLFLSPYFSGAVHQFEADQVKEVKLEVRSPAEFRTMHLVRDTKNKSWREGDKSSLREFKADSEKVNQFVKDMAKLKTDRFAVFALPAKTAPKDPKVTPPDPLADYRLGDKEFTVKVELVIEDKDKKTSTITLTVGSSPQQGQYFAHSTHWPETIFFLPESTIEPLLRGPAHFAKERIAGN
jgi:hypothetical protein